MLIQGVHILMTSNFNMSNWHNRTEQGRRTVEQVSDTGFVTGPMELLEFAPSIISKGEGISAISIHYMRVGALQRIRYNSF